MAFFSKVRGMLQPNVTSRMGQEISASTPFLFQAIRCMSSKIFVGGLSYQIDEATLQQTFEKYGQVYEARIIQDRETGNSRGFGFVTFESTESANSAIMALDGQELQGRRLKVNHAHDRALGFGGGRGGGYSGNYQGGGGYGGNYQGEGGYGGNYQGGGGYGGNYQGEGGYGGNNYQGGGGYGGNNNQEGGGYGGNYQGGGGYGGNYPGGAAYNDSVNNYQGGGENYSNNPNGVSGYNTTGGGSYDSNFSGSGGDYNSTGGNYPSSRSNLETGGDFPMGGNESHDQPPGVTFGGGAGSDNYNADGSNAGSNFTTSGYENASGLSYDGADQFGNNVKVAGN